MNILKTNPLGIKCIENKIFKNLGNKSLNLIKSEIAKININDSCLTEYSEKYKLHAINTSVFNHNEDSIIIRISKQIRINSELINLSESMDRLSTIDYELNSMIIILDSDKEGIIKVERTGSDFTFLFLKNLDDIQDVYFNSFSFLTKEFAYENNITGCLFVVKILIYLNYGDITEKYLKPKQSLKLNSFSKFLNNSKLNIKFVDSLWKQRIHTDGFKVRGHFRLQPIGLNRSKRKLIWINEFDKKGYNRKATIELL